MSSDISRIFTDDCSREIWHDPCPNVLLMGLARSGKSSIVQVVFNKVSPYETIDACDRLSDGKLELKKVSNSKYVEYAVGEIPWGVDVVPHEQMLFSRTNALVVVINAQNEPYKEDIRHATDVISRAWQINRSVHVEVFVHKLDGDLFSLEETKTECQREIQSHIMEHLYERGIHVQVGFSSTSIYDHTIFEALSRVVQRLVPEVSTIEQLLDLVVTSCRVEKAFLFDVVTKLFIATDSSPVEPSVYELCSDMIDVTIDVSCIYSPEDVVYEADEQLPDAHASCLIHLDNGFLLYLREVSRYLALVCVIRDEYFDRQHLVDHNIVVFRKRLISLFETTAASAGSRAAAARDSSTSPVSQGQTTTGRATPASTGCPPSGGRSPSTTSRA